MSLEPLINTKEKKTEEKEMCCNYGSSSIKSNLFFTLSSQTRPGPLPRISFQTHFPSQSVRFRIGSRLGFQNHPCSCKSMLKESICELESCCFYELLGIPETGTLLEIKQAYKQLARKYHPDVSPPDQVGENTQRFIRVQQAYEILSDPNRRALYDKDRAMGLHLALGARRRYQKNDEQMEEKGEWKSRWQSQVSELKRRSMHKDCDHTMSWGARMRRQNNDSSSRTS